MQKASSRSGVIVAAKIGAILVLTALCLMWVFWGIDSTVAWDALSNFRWGVLIPVLLLYTAMVPVRALRFQFLVDHPVPWRHMLSVVTVSFLAVNVIPLRMGEFVRPYLLWERYGTPLGAAMAALVLERMLDLLAMLAMMFLAAALVDLPPGGIEVGGTDLLVVGQRTVATTLAVGFLGVGVLIAAGEGAVDLVGRVARRVGMSQVAESVEALGLAFVNGFRMLLRRPSRGLGAVACTLGLWGLGWIALGTTMAGFEGLDPTWDRVLVNHVGAVIGLVLLPTPGFFGAWELGSTASLVLLGVDKTLAGTYSVASHLIAFLHTTGAGLLFLGLEGWSLVSVVQASRGLPASADSGPE